MKRARIVGLLSLLGGLLLVVAFRDLLDPLLAPIIYRVTGEYTVTDRLADFGEAARARMQSSFESAGLAYPPERVTLVAIKADRELHVYAGPAEGPSHRVRTYPVLGQSGELGPKLREGDRQVPEGLYRIEGLNPNSRFYVSLRLNYPNAWDRKHAATEGRDQPGSDIYIHGRKASVGCLAMGDEVIEEVFTLVADVGKEKVQVILAPVDFRTRESPPEVPGAPSWLPQLYADIQEAMNDV